MFTKEILYDLYYNKGLSINKIAKKYNISWKKVKSYFDKYNLSINYPIKINKKWLYNEYIIKKRTSHDIGKECNRSGTTILSYLKKFNIKIRNSCGENNGMFGKNHSEEFKQHLSELNSGNKNSFFGKKHTNKIKEKLSKIALKRYENPENHPRYIDGRGSFPYPSKFTVKIKNKILERDNNVCQLCGLKWNNTIKRKHHIHHIDYDKENCTDLNLICLCNRCNSHVNVQRNYWTKTFKLYQKLRLGENYEI